MPNLHRDKKIVRCEPERDESILRDHRQDGNVAIGGSGSLAHSGLSAVSEIQKQVVLPSYTAVSTRNSVFYGSLVYCTVPLYHTH